jgi:hypothetical protein
MPVGSTGPTPIYNIPADLIMPTTDIHDALAKVFAEIANGETASGAPVVLNSGDVGLLRSIDKLSATDASQSTNDGATIAAHAQHLRYGLSLMNLWATEGGDPFSDAKWDEAWKLDEVDTLSWDEIRNGLRHESRRWLQALRTPRECSPDEFRGMIGSIAHFAYHLGAIRQIHKATRGPTEGTFT